MTARDLASRAVCACNDFVADIMISKSQDFPGVHELNAARPASAGPMFAPR